MIYLDNAATSFPKPPQVARAMAGTLNRIGGNPGRAGHRISLAGGRVLSVCRDKLADMFRMEKPEQVIFTNNCTDGLNLAIRGSLHLGDEVIVSHCEHNAVMRVLMGYEQQGMITVKTLMPSREGLLEPHQLQAMISPKTALVVLNHASNVTGVVQPVSRLGLICKENGVPLLVDAAQTAGVLDVSPKMLNADMVAMAGHKGLLGPHGTGVLLLGQGMMPRPLREGGTGSRSESMIQPEELPDRYESGTMNLPGIAGLLVGARFVAAHMREIREYEEHLSKRLRDNLHQIPNVILYGEENAPKVGVVSFNVDGMESGYVADILDKEGFALRGGLHCAPSVHQWLGTLDIGAVRASVGIYNTEQHVDDLALVVEKIATNRN
jgi:cysteine desulfurase family protein